MTTPKCPKCDSDILVCPVVWPIHPKKDKWECAGCHHEFTTPKK